MKRIVCMLVALVLTSTVAHARAGRAFSYAFRLLSGLAAAKAIEATAQADEVYANESAIVDQLREAGVDPQGAAIYSLFLQMDPNNPYLRTADFWGNPDLMILVQIEGQGAFLVPNRWNGYAGQRVLENLVARATTPGNRILIHFLDDDSFMNTTLNSVLSSRVNFSLGAEFRCTQALSANISTDGSVQVLDRECVIKAPNYLGTAEFIVPTTEDGVWAADGTVTDLSGGKAGTIQFAQLWVPPEAFGSRGRTWFWAVVAIVLVSVFVKSMLSRDRESSANNRVEATE